MFNPVLSYLILFDLIRSFWIFFDLFGSYSILSMLFDIVRSDSNALEPILSLSILFDSNQIGLICFYSILFDLIQFYLNRFGPIQLYTILFHFYRYDYVRYVITSYPFWSHLFRCCPVLLCVVLCFPEQNNCCFDLSFYKSVFWKKLCFLIYIYIHKCFICKYCITFSLPLHDNLSVYFTQVSLI